MQDFATEEDVQAWVHSQPHGMGRLKLNLMIGEGRLSERGMAAARGWLSAGEPPQRIEPVLGPVATPVPMPAPVVVPPPVPVSPAGPAVVPPPLFPVRPVAVPAMEPAAGAAPVATPQAASATTTEPAGRAPARRKRFNWFEAIAIVLLLGVAAWLAMQLAHVAGRT